jgi:enediyne biosynthesis protein E4
MSWSNNQLGKYCLNTVGWGNALTLFFVIISCNTNENNNRHDFLFKVVDPSKSGITFSNDLYEDEEFNIIEYLYFYNGGGVAVGDINNDGLIDIYFSANQLPNKLYLNKGNMEFEDITEQARVHSFGAWKTGVSMVDINGDGLLDIYVCRLGNYKGIEGKNELYINNGDLTFTESAEEYGLDFKGFSTHAAFFDYDGDGDLDMYLLNHAVHTEKSYGRASLRYIDDGLAGDKLFRNNMEMGVKKFTSVTNEAGIFSSQIGYGLGVGIADVNNDGWPDIYVSNDFNENDYLYINQGNGSFKEILEEAIAYSSRFSMGNDLADFNNDGWIDIMTLDMLPEDEKVQKMSAGEDSYEIYKLKLNFGFGRQATRNMLQLNNKNGKFSEIAQLAGVYATDWSWSSLFADFDNDGWKDIFISNGINRRPNDIDYINYITERNLDGEIGNLELANKMPSGKVNNYLFKNNGDLTFQDVSREWGIVKPSVSNGAVYVDLDNDGDLDLIVNNINDFAGILENRTNEHLSSGKKNFIKMKFEGAGFNKFGIGCRVQVFAMNKLFIQENFTTRGFQSSIAPEMILGLGEITIIDSIQVKWPGGKMESLYNIPVNQTLIFEEAKAKPTLNSTKLGKKSFFTKMDSSMTGLDYYHIENEYNDFNLEPLIPHKLSMDGPAIAIGDYNGDGLEDIFLGGASGQPGVIYMQNNQGKFEVRSQPELAKNSSLEDVCAVFFDSNQNGLLDLVVGRGGNIPDQNLLESETKIYVNQGNGNYSEGIGLPIDKNLQVSVILPYDVDGDGRQDLMVGGRNIAGKYGEIPKTYILRNKGDGEFEDITVEFAPELQFVGMVKDAVWVDINQDGLEDLVVVGEWMPVTVFMNENGKLNNRTVDYGLEKTNGWWYSIIVEDLTGNGFPDLIIGNQGLNNRMKASGDFPLKMLVKDFDKNGSLEQILTYAVNGKYYTIANRDELVKKIPSIKKDFVRNQDFAGKSVEQIFSRFNLKEANTYHANEFSSMIFYNQGGTFTFEPLPTETQFSPIKALLLEDIDGDGIKDLITGGNNIENAPYFGAYLGSWGTILKGHSDGHFTPFDDYSLGISGQVKAIKSIEVRGQKWILFVKNNNELEVYQKQ